MHSGLHDIEVPTELVRAEEASPDACALDDALDATGRGPVPAHREQIHGIVIGRLEALAADGARVSFDWRGRECREIARVAGVLGDSDVGKPVALLFENADRTRPMIVGALNAASVPTRAASDVGRESASGRRVRIEADDELVLACGESSLTLTKAGKVLLKGRYVSNRSTGVLRLKGASVQIN